MYERGFGTVMAENKKLLALILSLVPVFSLVTTALSYSHTETYVIYRTSYRQVCSPSSQCVRDSDGCAIKQCVCDYHSEAFSVAETNVRCQTGWHPYPACNEFNECTQGTSRCSQECTDTVDSYTCSCRAGYRLAADGRSCIDIDECQERISNCSHICYNTVGSYKCGCNAGCNLSSNGLSCQDNIDECTEETSGCEHNCSNTICSHTCSCNSGYRLASNKRSCNDIDECMAHLDDCNLLENFTCENTIGGYRCVCKTGFEQVGPRECRDINECENITNSCAPFEDLDCKNIIGSYRCQRNGRWMPAATVKMVISVTFGIVAGISLINIAVVSFFRRSKGSKIEKTEEKSDLQSEEATTDCHYQDLAAVTHIDKVYEVIKKPSKSNDISLQQKAKKDIHDRNVNSKESATEESTYDNLNKSVRGNVESSKVKIGFEIAKAANESVYQDLVATTKMQEVYEPINKQP